MQPDFDALPYLTKDLPGTGERIRARLEDFVVEEVPAYLPAGEGEHLYLWVEKRGLTTRGLVERLVALGVPEKAIGVAGLKDKYAVTRQWLSLPKRFEGVLAAFEGPEVQILQTELHQNKLKTGHLKGNRFAVLVEGAELARARAVLERLVAEGLPNYYGPQRFGLGGKNPERGLELMRKGKGRGGPWLKRFLLGSVQSLIFNAYLAERIERGLFVRLLPGDVAKKHDTGGEFLVEDAEAESARARRFEISATGPLFGKKYFEAEGEARALEDEVLARFGLDRAQFNQRKGARRWIRVPVAEARVEPDPRGVWLHFYLPKGSYATSLLREVMKKNPEATGPGVRVEERG